MMDQADVSIGIKSRNKSNFKSEIEKYPFNLGDIIIDDYSFFSELIFHDAMNFHEKI